MHIRKHTIPASLGLIALVALGLASLSMPSLSAMLKPNIIDIAVEHESPLSLSIEVGVRDAAGVIEFVTDTKETIQLSVPVAWKRREVRNVPIESVTSEAPSLGFTRWTLPPHAGISFSMTHAPESLVLHNPSGVQTKIDLTYVDVVTEEVHHEIVLLKDAMKKLW